MTLPDLAQVTGWSKAKPPAGGAAGGETANARPAGGAADPSNGAGFAHQSDRALFGGWRIEDMRQGKRKG